MSGGGGGGGGQDRQKLTKGGAAIDQMIKDVQWSKVFLHAPWKFVPILDPYTPACM